MLRNQVSITVQITINNSLENNLLIYNRMESHSYLICIEGVAVSKQLLYHSYLCFEKLVHYLLNQTNTQSVLDNQTGRQ